MGIHISKLTISDYLGIESIAIKPGEINLISGGNGQGKTAILKAIREAFIGSGVSPDLIRLDSKKAELLVELNNGMGIHRKITASNNTVSVVNQGQPLSKPVAFLKQMLGPAFLFNPVEFFLAKPKDRREMILKAVEFTLNQEALISILKEQGIPLNGTKQVFESVDFSRHGLEVLDEIKRTVYERRAEVNRDRDRLRKTIDKQRETIPETVKEGEFKDFDFDQAMAELREANEHNQRSGLMAQKIDSMHNEYGSLKREITETEQAIAEMQRVLEAKMEKLEEIKASGKALQADLTAFQPKPTAELEESLRRFNEQREVIQRLKEIGRYEGELEGVTAEWRSLDKLHKALANDVPRIAMRQVELPVQGLKLSGETVTLNGVAIDNLSGSERMRFAVELSRALAGDLKVICVDGAEGLDTDSLEAFYGVIKDDGVQYFITKVTSGELKVEPGSRGVAPKDEEVAPETERSFD